MREVKIYTFDELSEEVQNKVVERYSKMWSTEMNNELEIAMDDKFYDLVDGLSNTFELAYSLCYCQGDGVSFTGTVEGKEELTKLANLVYNGNIPRHILRLINWGIIYNVNFDRFDSHYVHKHTVNVEVVDNYNMDDNYYHIAEAMTEFEVNIKCWYFRICNKLEDFGYNEIEHLQSEECIRENLLDSELEFTEDGRDY